MSVFIWCPSYFFYFLRISMTIKNSQCFFLTKNKFLMLENQNKKLNPDHHRKKKLYLLKCSISPQKQSQNNQSNVLLSHQTKPIHKIKYRKQCKTDYFLMCLDLFLQKTLKSYKIGQVQFMIFPIFFLRP